MNANLMVLTMAVTLVAGMGTVSAFGQMLDPVMVTTDKESYSAGETIMVNGEVSQLLSGQAITVMVVAPNGNIVQIAQISSITDNKFSTELIAGGDMMKSEGTYTIKVLYGNETRTAETTFMFGGSDQTSDPDPGMDKSSIIVGEDQDPITYSITGGEVINMVPDIDSKSLIVTINAMNDGSLTLTIPRAVLDSVNEDGTDDEFYVLVDREEYDFEETKTEMDRMLTIEFPAGTEEIEIIGTWVVPEFGTIAIMILAVAIISIIAISARSRLSIMPRY